MPATTPLVLLHPYPADATFWNRFRSALGGMREIITPEAPGFGTAAPEVGWTIASAADAVAMRIGTAASHGVAYVMGLSMGGYTALALAARHPERVSALILADARAEADDPATRRARHDAAAVVAGGGRDGYLSGLLPRLVAADVSGDVRDELAACAGRQSSDALIGALAALAGRPDRRRELAHFALPTLVVVGSEDLVTPPAAARVLADGIPDARLVEISGAGHLTALERPHEVAEVVAGFLRGLPDRH
jgi:pimeloyl-ACP methyl ester carboxylesterase